MIKRAIYVICGEDNSFPPYPLFNVYTAHETRMDAIHQLHMSGFYETTDNTYRRWDDEDDKENRYIKQITMIEDDPYFT